MDSGRFCLGMAKSTPTHGYPVQPGWVLANIRDNRVRYKPKVGSVDPSFSEIRLKLEPGPDPLKSKITKSPEYIYV